MQPHTHQYMSRLTLAYVRPVAIQKLLHGHSACIIQHYTATDIIFQALLLSLTEWLQ